MGYNDNYLITSDGGGERYLRIRRQNRTHPVAEYIMYRLEPWLMPFTLLATGVVFLVTNYLLGYSWLLVFDCTFGTLGGFYLGGLWIFLPLIRRMLGYRKVPDWEVRLDRRNAYVRSLSGYEATEFFREEYLNDLRSGTSMVDLENKRNRVLQRLDAAERKRFLRDEVLAADTGAGVNRQRARDFNAGVATGYVAGRQQSRNY
ncbi:hypothetical protein H7F10_07050 [Acidithiobacillus sp. HP-6]|uniref:hypothetical protein n=1 Tax=unclassified Acidithiobacillus TaxID=2614800 RepID=UPI001879F301|nr:MULTISPECIES: hypothetical protein [unclassified Acidithiobacillus]MBE7562712.1 hypothetical protein [Acidithiobacillus sp. HP-6]MBE7570492.1 hypothetical protein [Acidithiobacillus sp. HP-2]